MPKHVWSFSVKTDAGSGPVDTLTITRPAEINIGNSGTSAFQVGVQDVNEWDGSITVANVDSFFIEGDQDMRVRVNSETVPDAEFNLIAKQALGWNSQDLPHGTVNPLAGITTITKLFFYNKGTVKGVVPSGGSKVCNVQCGFLLNQDVVFS